MKLSILSFLFICPVKENTEVFSFCGGFENISVKK